MRPVCGEATMTDDFLWPFPQKIENEKVSGEFSFIPCCSFGLYRLPLLRLQEVLVHLLLVNLMPLELCFFYFKKSDWKQDYNHRESKLITEHKVEPQVQVPIAWLEPGFHAPQARNESEASAGENSLALTEELVEFFFFHCTNTNTTSQLLIPLLRAPCKGGSSWQEIQSLPKCRIGIVETKKKKKKTSGFSKFSWGCQQRADLVESFSGGDEFSPIRLERLQLKTVTHHSWPQGMVHTECLPPIKGSGRLRLV